MKKAIVTGATGFIGSAFVEYLTDRRIDVLALGRKSLDDVAPAKCRMLQSACYLKVDMSEIARLDDALSSLGWEAGDDCVFFNLAWGGASGLSDLDVAAQLKNVAWSVAALEVARMIGCERFIQVGTMEEAFTEKYLELDRHQHKQHNRQSCTRLPKWQLEMHSGSKLSNSG